MVANEKLRSFLTALFQATEQFVLQQLKTLENVPVYYWTNNNENAEIDFVIQLKSNVIPIEAKASVNLNAKSLKVYRELFSPDLSVRTSMAEYIEQEKLINLPLYAIKEIGELL